MSMSPREIDHVVIAVEDHAKARELYNALGFTLTPPARHPFGTGNSLVQLQDEFLELLSVFDVARIPPPDGQTFAFADRNRRYLEQRQGMSMLVLKSDDAEADTRAWNAAGIATLPLSFARTAKAPDGREAEVRFSSVGIEDPLLGDAVVFACQHHQPPELFWCPAYQRHANTAQRLCEVVMVSPQPELHVPLFESLCGTEHVQPSDGGIIVALGQVDLNILHPSHFGVRSGRPPALIAQPGFRAITIEVTSLSAAANSLDDGGIPYNDFGDGLMIAPEDALGVGLGLVEIED